jgi:branched-chain amino acid transport system permease protein
MTGGIKLSQILIAIAVFLVCLVAPPLLAANDYFLQVLFRVALFAALGLAWNMVGGYAGQLSLGHVAFFGVGAYGLVLFNEAGVPVWLALFLAAVVSAAFAGIIGAIVFRLRGPYFAISTIACAEVVRLIATNSKTMGGAIGLTTPALFTGASFWKLFYASAVALAAICFLVNVWISRSRFGYYLMAIREDQETASAVGIDTARYKLYSFIISAFLTGLGGALYGSAFQFIVPDSILATSVSIQIAIIAMLGGAGTILGPIVGAVVLISASEVFKNQFQESHTLIYGVLIVLVVLFLREGIVGSLAHLLRRWRASSSNKVDARISA